MQSTATWLTWLCVGHDSKPCKNSQADQDTVWGLGYMDSDGTKEPSIPPRQEALLLGRAHANFLYQLLLKVPFANFFCRVPYGNALKGISQHF